MIAVHNHAGGVQDLVIVNPPVNALAASVRQAIRNAVMKAQDDPNVRAIVIRGAGKFFSAGADITEFSKPPQQPILTELISTIENCETPIIAAISGVALGGGLELAMGCHYRIATPAAKMGLPEVKLGLLPGAGGAQRLPRLIGMAAALPMIILGEPITGEQAHAMGLIDRLVDAESLNAAAIAFARTVAGPRKTGALTVAWDDDAFVQFARNQPQRYMALEAVKANVDAIKRAAELPIDECLAQDRKRFLELAASDQSRGLRHAFFAERAAARVEALSKDIKPRPITQVGIIGAGTMGGGIAMNFLSAGLRVVIVETSVDRLEHGISVIRKNYEASARKGRIDAEHVDRAMALLQATCDFTALASCDLVIEAAYENLDLKKQIFSRLDAIARPGAVLASNTSYLSIDEIAAVTRRPQDVLGLHFFSPANVMRLVEIVRGRQTSPDAIATAQAIARQIGKVSVVAGVCYGFIGNRMLAQRQKNALALLLEGATPDQVDRVHTAFGMPMGPFQMTDLAGVDIGWHRDVSRIETLKDALCATGRLGQKVGKGFYNYDDNRRPSPSIEVATLVDDFRLKSGVRSRIITDDEIVARTMFTMVNEGLMILDEGIAQRASDIDAVWIHGYGWPRSTGGPMFWADQMGAKEISKGLYRYADRLGPDFKIAPALSQKATNVVSTIA